MSEQYNPLLQTTLTENVSAKPQMTKPRKTTGGDGEKLYEELYEALNKDPDIRAYEQAEWEAPVTFDKDPVPLFPINIFNEPIKSMVGHVSESI